MSWVNILVFNLGLVAVLKLKIHFLITITEEKVELGEVH